jgi:TolA-binding protein
MKTPTIKFRNAAIWAILFLLLVSTGTIAAQKDTTRISIGGTEFIITEKIKQMEKGISGIEKGKATFKEQIRKAEEAIAEAEKEIEKIDAQLDSVDAQTEKALSSQKKQQELIIKENEKRIEAFEEGLEDMDEAMADLKEEMEDLGEEFENFDPDHGDVHIKGYKSSKSKKFKGHWAGFEFGLSNFMNKEMTLTSDADAGFMALNPEKSFGFALNFMEFNLPVIRNNFGFTTGMGIKWNHFNLAQNVDLYEDEFGVIQAEPVDPNLREYKRNNLNMAYLTIPLIAEIQVKAGKEKLYLSGGATGSMRLWSKHKQKYLVDGNKYKDKVTDDFQLSPFRYGLTFRAGYGPVGLFVNYELAPLFKADRGPELYPVTIGLRLINF